MFDNTESVVIQSKNDISMEGIDCIFGSLGDIRYMYRDPQKNKKNHVIWICYTAHSMAMRAVEIDSEIVGGSAIRVEPAQFYIRDQIANKGKRTENPSSYSYSSDYSTDADAENSQSDDYIPIYSAQPLTTLIVTQQDQWPERIEQRQKEKLQKQESKKKERRGKNKKRRSRHSSDYSDSSSYSYSSYSNYSSYSSYSNSSYESDTDSYQSREDSPARKHRHHKGPRRH